VLASFERGGETGNCFCNLPILFEACAVMSSSLCSQNLILVFKHGGNEVVW